MKIISMGFFYSAVVLLLIFLPSVNLEAGTLVIHSLNNEVSLSGNWKIRIGDDKDYSSVDYDDSSWDDIYMPGSFLQYERFHNNSEKKICWLRKKIIITKEVKHDNMGLILGTISNADVTFFNGEKIGSLGSFPPGEQSMWNFPRHYAVPGSTIHYGGINVIAIRISYGLYGDMVGKIAIANYRDWKQDCLNFNLLNITLCYVVIGIGLGLFIMFMFYFSRNPEETEYLFYCIMLVAGFFIIFDFCNFWPWIYGNDYFRRKLLLFSYMSLNVAFPIFLHRLFEFERKTIERLLYIALIGYILVDIFLFLLSYDDFLAKTIVLIFLSIIGIYNLSCYYYAVFKGKEYAKMFAIFGTLGTLSGFHDIIAKILKMTGMNISVWGYHFFHMKIAFTGIFIFLGTAMVMVYRWINLSREVIDLNNSLENYIIENTLLQNEKKLRKNSIQFSNKFKEKIQKVADFIAENYLHDLSREGLAAYVDMHPDSLSRMFNKYTSMKLSDYIYNLRVVDARERLVETNEGITEIALSVGFENLRTFNRAFKKFMKMTPGEFRKKNKNK